MSKNLSATNNQKHKERLQKKLVILQKSLRR